MRTHRIELELPNTEATRELGHRLGERLFPGTVLALVGNLGAGKTYLTQALAEGLKIPDSRVVNSPTFVLIQEYRARLPIYHFDPYRLTSVAQFANLGVHEYLQGDGVCVIEWANRVVDLLPEERLTIELTTTGDTSRHVVLTAVGDRHIALIDQIGSMLTLPRECQPTPCE